MDATTFRTRYLNRHMLACIGTGFASGLPFFVIYQLIPAWLRTEGISLKEIGFFTLVGIPYTWKFLWAPLMDRYCLPLGHRRGWMLLTQIALLLSIAALGLFQPQQSLMVIAYIAAAMAFFSASQDIVLDAYRRELLNDDELGLGNSIHIQAYRLAGLVPGSLGLILAGFLPWAAVFQIVGGFMLLGIMFTLLISETGVRNTQMFTLQDSIVKPFQEFFARLGRNQAIAVLAFMMLYKLGDSMATALSTTFYIDIGFTMPEIGLIAKNASLWSAIIGGMLAIPIIDRYGVNRSLWMFGLVQIASILGFLMLAEAGPDRVLLAIVISFEYLAVGMGTAAFIAFIAQSTSRVYAATQFALLTAITAMPRTFANALTGIIVEHVGWPLFFCICAILSLPGMVLLMKVAPWHERS